MAENEQTNRVQTDGIQAVCHQSALCSCARVLQIAFVISQSIKINCRMFSIAQNIMQCIIKHLRDMGGCGLTAVLGNIHCRCVLLFG